MTTARVLTLVCLAAAVSSCEEFETAVLIRVESDLGADLTRVEVEIRDSRDRVAIDGFSFDSEVDKSYRVPFSFRVEPREMPSGSFVVKATGYRREMFLSEIKQRIWLSEGSTLQRTVRLPAGCRGLLCANGETCDPTSYTCTLIPSAGLAGSSGAAGSGGQGGAGEAGGGAGGARSAGTGAGGAGRGAAGRGAAAAGGAGAGGAGSDGGILDPTSTAAAGGGGDEGLDAGGEDGEAEQSGTLTGRSDIARVTHDGRSYIVQNNVYSPGAMQTLHYRGSSFTIASVTGEDSKGVSFPASYIGSVYTRASDDSNLPKQLRAIQSVAVELDTNAGMVPGTYHAAHALWFSAGSVPDDLFPSGGVLEVWYFVQTPHDPPASLTASAVTIAGVEGTWNVWQAPCFDQPCIWYVRTQPLAAFRGDLQPFLADAASRSDSISANAYLSAVFAGFELQNQGAGLEAREITTVVH